MAVVGIWPKEEEEIQSDLAAKEDYNGQDDTKNRTLIRINCVGRPQGNSIDLAFTVRADIPIN